MSETDEHTSETHADWLAELADAAVPPSTAVPEGPSPALTLEALETLPPVERTRQPRRPIVPTMVWIVAAAVLGVAVVGAIIAALVGRSSVMVTPGITGEQLSVARTELERRNIRIVVSERRFSSAPKDRILSQSPSAGSSMKRGAAIRVVVSAGTEEFAMPDVVGNGINLAKGTLESRGLVVVVETVASDVASNTVVGTAPAAGATVRTGDTVTIQVASTGASSNSLQPYDLSGLSVVIDPVPGVSADPALDVARRLRALLEASGAQVVMTRTAADSSSSDAQRAARAGEASATIGIGLQMTETGAAGRVVSVPSTLTAFIGPSSATLGSAVMKQFSGILDPTQRVEPTTPDAIFGTRQLPWVRVTLGSSTAADDSAAFKDVQWVDKVARALYRALGETYGTRPTR